MQEAIRAIKAVCPEMIDARCLRTLILYTRRYIENGEVANDANLMRW
jgi:hypothetical protein